MSTIFLVGMSAIKVAFAANRMPEIFNVTANLWRPARSFPEARQLADKDPTLVRMQCDARVLLEDLGGASINHGDDLLLAALSLPLTVSSEVRNIIEKAVYALKE